MLTVTLLCSFIISVHLVLGKEPVCDMGAPLQLLADEDRCDRFWECEDGIISDKFCDTGSGFDAVTKKCTDSAPCLKDATKNSEGRSATASPMPFFLQVLTKSILSPQSSDSLSGVIGLIKPLFGSGKK